jgi:hypothetical protein
LFVESMYILSQL